MGTRTGRKDDFTSGFGYGVVEHSHKDVMGLPHHPSSSSPSASSLCCVSDPFFSASSTQAYTSSLGEMFSLHGFGSSLADPFFSLTSSGEMGRCMNDKAGAAFSEAQWHELERQKSIFKYMMASAPSGHLPPFSKNPNAHGGSLKLGIASNASKYSADLEPWRCKRTDGKKWRCSRNVIPDQKYCERHTHKSRPRSRKHVESSHHNVTRAPKKDTPSHFARTYPQFYGQPESKFSLPSATSSYDHQRGLKWFMKEEDAIGSSRDLKHGFNYDLNFRQQKEPLVDQSFGALQGLLSLNQTPHVEETRRFAVEGELDEAMGSSLTLSMAGGGMEEAEEVMNQHQWVRHGGPSWLCSTTPGGPLAEALCLGVSSNPSTSSTTSSCSRNSN